MTIGATENLSSVLGRISTPAKETRDMLALVVDMLMSKGDGPVGTSYFVDGVNGSNSNNGLQLASPKLTIKAAMALCVADQNDTIFVMDYWQPSGEDWPIVVDKNLVHIVGLAQRNLPYPAIVPTGDTAAFQLTSSGQYGSIENLSIGGGDAHGCIEWGNSGQVDGFLIRKCWFGYDQFSFGTPLNGIRQVGTASRGGYGNRIEKCTFLGDLAAQTGAHLGGITGNAIAQLSTTLPFFDLEIVDNVFKGCQRALNLLCSKDAVIEENRFTVPDKDSAGESIWIGAAGVGNMINNNYSFKGTGAALTYNPYYDASNSHWGLNYRQGVSVMPATP